GSKVTQVNDSVRLMAPQLQSGADAASTVKQAVASVDTIVGK
ncbi:MAG: hypothetical protein JWR01_911, partial [Subtercola sp.]|nr:hypothetical protein [Subtercola sp.]